MKQRHRHPWRRRGFNFIELTISTLLVGIILVAALNATGQSLLGQRLSADRALAQSLANDLMTEILPKAYVEPSSGIVNDLLSPAIGRDLGESATLRSTYDDVDDYHGYDETPPTAKDGTSIPGLSGWRRTVQVVWVHPTTLANSATGTGAKKITVTVKLSNVTLATATAFRTIAP